MAMITTITATTIHSPEKAGIMGGGGQTQMPEVAGGSAAWQGHHRGCTRAIGMEGTGAALAPSEPLLCSW